MEEWYVIWRATVICYGPLWCILGALVIIIPTAHCLLFWSVCLWLPLSQSQGPLLCLCYHGDKLKCGWLRTEKTSVMSETVSSCTTTVLIFQFRVFVHGEEGKDMNLNLCEFVMRHI